MKRTKEIDKKENTIEINYHGNVVMGLPVLVFRFLLNIESKRTKIYRYEWINPPTAVKNVLALNQMTIISKTELSKSELLSCLEDMYEVFHEQKEEMERRANKAVIENQKDSKTKTNQKNQKRKNLLSN